MIEKRRIKYYITNTRVQLKFLYTNFIVLVPIAALYFHLEDRNKSINDFRANKILTCTLKNLVIDVSNAVFQIMFPAVSQLCFHFCKQVSRV